MQDNATNTFQPDRASYYKRLMRILFPWRVCENPRDLEGFSESYMTYHIICVLDWKDRLRCLISGKLEVEVKTKTDVVVNKAFSTSAITILAPSYKIPNFDVFMRGGKDEVLGS